MNQFPETPFIGRQTELDWLKDNWTEAFTGKPRVCILRGESGFGKTRLVQAFYSWLSSNESYDPDGYWPDALLSEESNLRINPAPSSFAPSGTLPWLWWGIRWDDPNTRNRIESTDCALLGGLSHLEPHRQVLESRVENLKHAGKVAAELGDVALSIVSLGAIDAAKSLFDMVKLLGESRERNKHDKLSVEERQHHTLQCELDGLFEFLRAILNPGVQLYKQTPLLLVLDDAQWMDKRSLELIRRLLHVAENHDWPLMLIVTHWERDWYELELNKTQESFPSLCTGLMDHTTINDRCSLIEICDLGGLSGLDRMLSVSLPGLTQPQIDFLCNRADGNPRLMTEIILELRGENYYFENEDITLSLSVEGMEALEGISFSLHEVQKRRFRCLDEDLRRLLSYASHQGFRFLRTLALDVANRLDAESSTGNAADQLELAVQPYARIENSVGVCSEFRHRIFHELAYERIVKLPLLGKRLCKAVLEVAEEWLDNNTITRLEPAELESFCIIALQQLENSRIENNNLKLRLLVLLLEHYRAAGYFQKALNHLTSLQDLIIDLDKLPISAISVTQHLHIITLHIELERYEEIESFSQKLMEGCERNAVENTNSHQIQSELADTVRMYGDVRLHCNEPDHAKELYNYSLSIYDRLFNELGESEERLEAIAALKLRIGRRMEMAGIYAVAFRLIGESLTLYEQILSNYGESAERLRAVANAQYKYAWMNPRNNEAGHAHRYKFIEKSLMNRERIILEFGETAQTLEELNESSIQMADFYSKYEPKLYQQLVLRSLAITERIISKFGETADRLAELKDSQSNYGSYLLECKDVKQAIETYKQSITTAERESTVYGETASRLDFIVYIKDRLGLCLIYCGEPEAAAELFKHSLSIWERMKIGELDLIEMPSTFWESHYFDFLKSVHENNQERALAVQGQWLSIREEILLSMGETAERLDMIAQMQFSVSYVLGNNNQIPLAIEVYKRSVLTRQRILVKYGESLEHLKNMMVSQQDFSRILLQHGRIAHAITAFEQSCQTRQRLLERRGVTVDSFLETVEILKSFGSQLAQKGYEAQALGFFEQSFTAMQRIFDEHGQAKSLLLATVESCSRIGNSLVRFSLFEAGHTFHQRALGLTKQLNDTFGESKELLDAASSWQFSAGLSLLDANLFEFAAEFYELSLANEKRKFTELDDSIEATYHYICTLCHHGSGYLDCNQFDRGRSLIEQACTMAQALVTEFGETNDSVICMAISLLTKAKELDTRGDSNLAQEKALSSEAWMRIADPLDSATHCAEDILSSLRYLVPTLCDVTEQQSVSSNDFYRNYHNANENLKRVRLEKKIYQEHEVPLLVSKTY